MNSPKYSAAQDPTSGQYNHNAGPQNYYGSADENSYTRPPPTYADDEALLRGGIPRNSEDNVPDDFKYGGFISDAGIDIRQAFVRKVYVILEAQLLTTAAVSSISFFNVGFKTWIQTHPWMMYLSFGLSIGFLIATFSKRRSYPMNMAFLSCFTLVEAYTVAVVTSFYDSKIVLEAVVITGALFFVLSLFACQTKYDITAWQGYLFGALCMLMIFGFVGFMFFPGDWVELAYAWGAAFVFSGYIMVDTQMILRKSHVEEEVMAAISLYLDIINLFLAILRILNSANDN